jgi:hypothetical protein
MHRDLRAQGVFMNSRERVAAAMRHEMPDRVPVMCQLALGHYFLNSDAAPSDIWFDSKVFARTLAEFAGRYRFDGLLLNLPGRPVNWRDRIASYERIDGGENIQWKDGLRTFLPHDDNAQTLTADGEALPRVDYAEVDPDDPATYRVPGLVWNTWHAPVLWDIPDHADLTLPGAYPDWLTLGLRTAREMCPYVSVHMEVFSPFTFLMELFGYENALMALIDAPETCHVLLDRFTAIAGDGRMLCCM